MRKVAALMLMAALAGCAGDPLPLERRLATEDSATRVLEGWCGDHRLAASPAIVAEPIAADPAPVPANIQVLLEASPGETVRHRHVRLRCGEVTMSVAHNWYVPSRLPPAINAALERGNIPFGKAVAAVGFRRERISSGRSDPLCPADTRLAQRARLLLPDGRPLAALVECYPRAIARLR